MKHVLGNLIENKMSIIINDKPFIRIKEAMLGNNKDEIDKTAAALFLQGYLDGLSNK